MINRRGHSILPGEQVFFSYGRKSNSYFVENYGFTLDESNAFASLEFRVSVGINPKDKVKSVEVFFPGEALLQDLDNIDNTTVMLRVKGQCISEGLLTYLRDNLLNNYEGPDKSYIMIASPRVIQFELLILDFALDLLYAFPDTIQGKVFK